MAGNFLPARFTESMQVMSYSPDKQFQILLIPSFYQCSALAVALNLNLPVKLLDIPSLVELV